MDIIPILTDDLNSQDELEARKLYEIEQPSEFAMLALAGVLGLLLGALTVYLTLR